ncbi:MAG: transglutaminase-like domain-containing protein [Planctomycetaceae bacterium]|nr:transglutaminase-like domain-containing protein [Planctomycetaceae bacterium]
MRRLWVTVVWLAATQLAMAGVDAGSRSLLGPSLSRTGGNAEADGFVGVLNPLETRLLADAADGRLDGFSPLGAALVASGVGDADSLQQYLKKAAALADQLQPAVRLIATERQRVEAIFDFMHQRVLVGGYDLASTDLRQVLDHGRFNCISATALFNYLAEQCGLQCHGLEMPGHAMSRVMLADGPLDVETTCPRWFLMTEQERSRQPVNAAGAIGSAGLAARMQAREVSPIQMAAMIYYNRGVSLLAEHRFAEAAAANAKAVRLDPNNATARGNLLATVNNWSIELGNGGQWSEAIGLLRRGMAMDARFDAFAQNYVHLHHQWVEQLCRSGQFGAALGILNQAAAEMPDRDFFRQAQREVRERWAKSIPQQP